MASLGGVLQLTSNGANSKLSSCTGYRKRQWIGGRTSTGVDAATRHPVTTLFYWTALYTLLRSFFRYPNTCTKQCHHDLMQDLMCHRGASVLYRLVRVDAVIASLSTCTIVFTSHAYLEVSPKSVSECLRLNFLPLLLRISLYTLGEW